jgi:hypothetical protein
MGIRWLMWVVAGIGLGLLAVIPSVRAADGDGAQAAVTEATTEVTLEQIREAINTETDSELKAAMEEQLNLVESGELNLGDLEHTETGGLALGAPPGPGELPGGLPGGTPMPMPVVDIGGGQIGPSVGGGTGGDSLPPDARKELEELFSQGTGDPNSQTDRELREQAEKILEKYGVETREDWGEHEEGDFIRSDEGAAGVERAFEQMSPEAREQMERFYGGQEGDREGPEVFREFMEREHLGTETSRETETTVRETEAPTREYEAMTHEYEAPSSYEAPEVSSYEAPSYEAPSYEAPSSYETPSYEGGGYGGYEGQH